MRVITDYKGKAIPGGGVTALLADDFNTFNSLFEVNTLPTEMVTCQDTCPLEIYSWEVCKTLQKSNPHKAPGPHGIPGPVLKNVSSVMVTTLLPFLF